MIQKNLANIITSLRIIFLPVLIYFFLTGNRMGFLYTAVVITITDMIDGTIARLLKQESDFGRMLDSFADFVFFPAFNLGTIFLLRVYSYIPLWIIVAHVAIPMLCVIIVPFLMTKSFPVIHLRSGQITTYSFLLYAVVSFVQGVSVPLYYIYFALSIVASLEVICIYIRDGKNVDSSMHSFFDKPKTS